MNKPINQIRRTDREVTDQEWIKNFLLEAPFGVLATVSEDQPFINNNLFVYDEDTNAIYIHTASQGRTAENIKTNRKVCFTAAEMGRLLPAEEAREFSLEYASVVVYGHAEILSEISARIYALQCLLDKYFPHLRPGRDYPGLDEKALSGTAVYKINIKSWSGKEKKVSPDFPGAFNFGNPPRLS